MRTWLLFVALLLAGCAPAIRPGAPLVKHVDLPEALVTSNPAVSTDREMALPEKWWHEFHAPNLDKIVDIALAGNPGLKQADARLQKAQAVVVEARSALSPHVDSSNRIIRNRNSRNGNHSIYNGKTATIGDLHLLSVNYHLDFWKRDEERISASLASQQATAARYRQSALMLSSAVVKTYFALNTERKLVAAQTEIVQLSEAKARLLADAYRAGIQPETPYLSQQADLLEAKNTLASFQKQREILRFALLELLGKEPDDNIPTASAATHIPDRFPIPQRIDLALISQRPDIQAALWRVRQQSHLEKVAQKAFYPNINLFALAGLNSIGLSNLLSMGSSAYAFGPAVELPLFEGGELKGKLHESEADYDVAVHAYNQAVIAAIRQIAEALSTLQYTRIKLDDRAAAAGFRVSEAAIAETAFRSGISGKLPYLEAAIRMQHAKMAHMEESLNWLNSITDTATALGGGFGKWPA